MCIVCNIICYDFQLEKRNVSASQTLRSALFKTENTHPGFAYNLVAGIMKQGDISININESILRLQGTVSDLEGKNLHLLYKKSINKIFNWVNITDMIYRKLKLFFNYH